MNHQAPNTQALPAGTRLEEFVIERVLGAGGFGITYLARDVSLGRQVVIKENLPVQFCFRDPRSLTVSPRHTSGEDLDNFQWSLENFSRESAMLASLDHPGIVRVHRSFQAFGTAYFVMPYVEGMALDELAKKRGDRSFTEEELVSLLKETLSALGYLHDRGIYHRDIKPGNILITDQGKPVLIDFGSARQRLSERSMTVVESAGYTPFEQLQSRGNVGSWSDLYALAATMVKVMTGEAPPKANDRGFGDSWQPLSGRAELTRRFSPMLLCTLDRGLKLPIEERWQNAGDWQKALKSGKVPVAADATNKKALSDEEKVVRKKHVWPKVVAALMIVGAASGWWLLRSAETDSPVQLVSEPKSGGLVITSEPSGAEVMQGENPLGKTPLELTGLSGQSRWEGSLKKEGYEVAEILSEVISGETKLVPQIVLIPSPQKVIVTSDPSGAEVWEGDKVLGKTPFELKSQPVGRRVNYQLRLEGHEEKEIKSEVLLGEALQLSAKLEEKPKSKTRWEVDDDVSERVSLYPWKLHISTATFWIGEQTSSKNPIINNFFLWDSNWSAKYGGYDTPDPKKRIASHESGVFRPKDFEPKLNPFYVALPYNDKQNYGYRPEARTVIPWFNRVKRENGDSVLKGRWVQVYSNNRSCYAQWEAVGPILADDWRYVFGNNRPVNTNNGVAGIAISPAVRDYLGIANSSAAHWRFVEDLYVPYGPWKKYGPLAK